MQDILINEAEIDE